MQTSTTKGRVLAIAAGAAFAIGGLTILLDKELIHPIEWSSSQWLTILTVFGTISAGHLMADAARARHILAAAGFLVLFLSGTGIVVYNSVGRQVEAAGTNTLSVEDTNKKIVEKSADLESAKARRDYADKAADNEMTGQRCGPRCKEWKTNSKDITVVIHQLEAEIAALGPQKPVNAQAAAMADILVLLHVQATPQQIVAALVLLIPFAKCLFFEIGSIVSLGFAFRSTPRTISKSEIVPAAANDTSGQSDFSISEHDFRAFKAMVSGELPEPPTPPKPGKRAPIALPANVIPLIAKHPVEAALERNGGSVASNRELARLMSVTEGEASKRWQEIQTRLNVQKVGKQLRIALKA